MRLVLEFLRARTIYALILLLAVFVLGVELVRPGTVTPLWASNAVLFAAPLAIMGAGQTLVMLTGGIDLSVASVATGSAYLLATNASAGDGYAIGIAILLGIVVGIVNGIGVALLRVQPLGDDARHRLDDQRGDDRLQPAYDGEPAPCARRHPDAWGGKSPWPRAG